MSSVHHVTMSSCHRVIMSSCHHVIMSSSHQVIMSSCLLLTTFCTLRNVSQSFASVGNFCYHSSTFCKSLAFFWPFFWQHLSNFYNFRQSLAFSRTNFFASSGHLCQILATFVNLCQFLATFGNLLIFINLQISRQLLAICCQCLAIFCNLSHLFASFGNFCQLSATLAKLLPTLANF